MKKAFKIVSALILFIFLISGSMFNVAAANGDSLEFLTKDWSENNLYPEWYGGRYIDDNGNMTYVIVIDYEDKLSADFLNSHHYTFKKYSYNELMMAYRKISSEWMENQPSDDAPYIYIISLDEIINCISINLNPENSKVEIIKKQFEEDFDDLVNISTENNFSVPTLLYEIPPNKSGFGIWVGFIMIIFIITGALFIFRRYYSHCNVKQTNEDIIVDFSHQNNMAKNVLIIKTNTETPSDSLFDNIMNNIDNHS